MVKDNQCLLVSTLDTVMGAVVTQPTYPAGWPPKQEKNGDWDLVVPSSVLMQCV